jgi:hypothetical protein
VTKVQKNPRFAISAILNTHPNGNRITSFGSITSCLIRARSSELLFLCLTVSRLSAASMKKIPRVEQWRQGYRLHPVFIELGCNAKPTV